MEDLASHSKINFLRTTLLHPVLALLSPGNPNFNFVSRGKQEEHINENATLRSYDQWGQPNTLLITLSHLPVLFVKCSRNAALSPALEGTGFRGERTGRLKENGVDCLEEGLWGGKAQFGILSLIIGRCLWENGAARFLVPWKSSHFSQVLTQRTEYYHADTMVIFMIFQIIHLAL